MATVAFACGSSPSSEPAGRPSPAASVVTPAPQQLAAPSNATTIALDADYVYWTSEVQDDQPGHISISRVPKAGGAAQLLVSTRSGGQSVGLVVNAGTVYWTMLACSTPCDFPGASEERVLFRLPIGTSAVQRMGLGYGQLAFDDTYVYVGIPRLNAGPGEIVKYGKNSTNQDPGVVYGSASPSTGLTSDADNIYWTETFAGISDSILFSFAAKDGKSSGTRRGLQPAHLALRLFISPLNFYFRGSNGVDRLGLNSPTENDLWNAPNGTDLDMKDGRLYWNQSQTSQYPGCLGSANYDGTDGKCLDQGPHTYGGVRVDDTAIYFIRDGGIWRLNR